MPVAFKNADSIALVAAKAQQAPILPWFLTGGTIPQSLKSKVESLGLASIISGSSTSSLTFVSTERPISIRLVLVLSPS